MFHHRYIIDRDERRKGGELIRLGTFDNWREAKDAWDNMPNPTDNDISLWLACVRKDNENDCETIDCKPR